MPRYFQTSLKPFDERSSYPLPIYVLIEHYFWLVKNLHSLARPVYFVGSSLTSDQMKIDHLAMWVDDLEGMRTFYTTYLGATAGNRYHNPTRQFTSYFLSFGPQTARLELMHRPDVVDYPSSRGLVKGITHIAFSVGSKEAVDNLTDQLRTEGYTIFSEARTTGDGYYESVVLDPEGNHLELTA